MDTKVSTVLAIAVIHLTYNTGYTDAILTTWSAC